MPQVAPTLEARALLVGADKGVMHQVLGVDVAARERAGVAAESRKLAEHVKGGRALKRHDPYTELAAELIRQGFKVHIVTHGQREAGGDSTAGNLLK